MSVNLRKGQKINLSKENRGLSRVMVGLGWDEVRQSGGLLGFLKGKAQDIDCDAFAILLGADGKVIKKSSNIRDCTVFFNNLMWPGGSIRHMGDNLTGAGEGDDEQIFVDLAHVPENIHSIVFAVNIYEAYKRKQHFGMIRNAFIRVVDHERNVELCRFELNENYSNKTALIAGSLTRQNGSWEFVTDGSSARVENLVDIVAAFH